MEHGSLGLTWNEEQIPPIIESKAKCELGALEGLFRRPRQVRYRAALRPGIF